jgi:hypothetical protein
VEVITAMIAAGAAAVTLLAGPAPHQASADCHALNVLISTPIVHGHPKIRASATGVCTTRPRTFHARLSILQHVRFRGHWRWVTTAYGPLDRTIPDPTRRYKLPIRCRAGTFRTEVTIGGRPRTGPAGPDRHFRSTPLVVRACVSGSAAPGPASLDLTLLVRAQ